MKSLNEILHRQITVARVAGIPIRIDYRWFGVFALSVWLFATNLQSGIGTAAAWAFGAGATALFFLCIFGHELAHAVAARSEGIGVEEIVLHPFGGLARMSCQPKTPGAEFRIAIAGPAASFLFAVALLLATFAASAAGFVIAARIFFLLFFGNLLLAIFNLLPGYPLDGGRVLRAWLWHRRGDMDEATRTVVRFGQIIAWAIVAFGVFLALRFFINREGDLFTGLWSIVVGLFLRDAAASMSRAGGSDKTPVASAMSAPFAVTPEMTVQHLVETILPLQRRTHFAVAVNGRLHGVLSLRDVQSKPHNAWRTLKIRDVMRPVAPEYFIEQTFSLALARRQMQANELNWLAVIDHSGSLVGVLNGEIKAAKSQ